MQGNIGAQSNPYKYAMMAKAGDYGSYPEFLQDIVRRGGDGIAAHEASALLGGNPSGGMVYSTVNPTGSGKNLGYDSGGLSTISKEYQSAYDAAAPQRAAAAQAQAQARANAARQAEVDSIMSSMRTLDQVLANRNRTTEDTYNQAMKSYDDTFALDRQARDKAQIQNEQTNTAARQAAMVQAAAGGRGLRSVLASMGALGGTGLDLANQAVSREANVDIGNADKNFQTNAGNISDSWARAEDEDTKRRAEARTIRENARTNNAAEVASTRQSMYNQLAGLFDRGTSQANSYLAQASALNPTIAAGSRQAVTPYTKSQQLFSPGKLQEYLGGVRDLSVSASAAPSGQSSTPINSPLFGQSEDKRRQIGVA